MIARENEMEAMYETEWECPITPEDEDTCPECGGDWNDEGCRSECINY